MKAKRTNKLADTPSNLPSASPSHISMSPEGVLRYPYLGETSIRSHRGKSDIEIAAKNMPPGTRVYIYLRHSPGDNQSMESQEAASNNFCETNNWEIVETFKDEGKSGSTTAGRDDFIRMMHYALNDDRPADIVVIWSYSRFGRNATDTQIAKFYLRMFGWKILSITEDIPQGEYGPIFELLIDINNQKFLKTLKADTIRGLKFIAKEGCLPSGRVCVGYTIHEKVIGLKKEKELRFGRKPVVDDKSAAMVRKAFEMKAAGATYKEIASHFTFFMTASPSTWNSFFTNRVFIGEYTYMGDTYKNVYPRIIEQELFDAVQKQIQPPKPKPDTVHSFWPKNKAYFLNNRLVCAYCGGNIVGKSVNSHRYYICSAHNKHSEDCPSAKVMPAKPLEKKILTFLFDELLTEQFLDQLLERTNLQLAKNISEVDIEYQAISAKYKEESALFKKTQKNVEIINASDPYILEGFNSLLIEKSRLVQSLEQRKESLEVDIKKNRIWVSREDISVFIQKMKQLTGPQDHIAQDRLVRMVFDKIIMAKDEVALLVHFPDVNKFLSKQPETETAGV